VREIISLKQAITVFLIISVKIFFAQEEKLAKTITVNFTNSTLTEIIKTIEKESEINFSYSNKITKIEHTISYSAKKPTREILTDISLLFSINIESIDNQLVVKKLRKADENLKKNKIEKYTISGFLKDFDTGENLINATILVAETNIGTVSNEYGFYSLTLPKGNYKIEISYIGFEKQLFNVTLDENKKISSNLKFNTEILSGVDINTDEEQSLISSNQMSNIKLTPNDIKTLPDFVGEVGLAKTLENIPGIKTYGDGSAFFFTRGGNKDQNLVLIDEAPIYNSAHLFGIYSVIIPETAKEINIYKGDLPVNFGDRISSVIDIRTKEGNLNKFGFGGVVNPFIYRFYVEIPIIKEKSSIYASFRHSNIKWIYSNQEYAKTLDIYFADFTSKINFKINNNNRIYYSIYYGKDNLSNKNLNNEKYGIDWANYASTLRWNHIFNSKLFSNFSIYGSQYNYNFSFYQTGFNNWNSSIGNLTFKMDFTQYTSPKLTFKYGITQNFQIINPGNINNNEQLNIPVIAQRQSRQSVFYFNNNYSFSDKISVNTGFRLPIWTNTGETTIYKFNENYEVYDTLKIPLGKSYKKFINFNPRASFRYELNKKSSIKISFGIQHQYLNLISNTNGPLSSIEIWLPSDENIKPQRSDIYAIGYTRLIKKSNLDFIAELFYKKMYNQIEYTSHANILLNPLLEGELRFGEGYSYGAEFFLKKNSNKLTGWISYTYSRAFLHIKDINNNNEFPAYYDQPHYFSFFGNYEINNRLIFSLNWIYHTGGAITSPIGFYKYNGNTVPIYGEKNNDRLPDYHRLDVSLSYKLNKKKTKYNHSLILNVYNIYNRSNALTYSYNRSQESDGSFVIPRDIEGKDIYVTTQTSLLGIIPSISYKFNF